MVLSKSEFAELDLPDFLLNIWDYSDNVVRDPVVSLYCESCVELARQRWCLSYKHLQFVINNLRKRNKQFYNFGKISSADKNIIYRLIWDQN